jgi:hypothetical protein
LRAQDGIDHCADRSFSIRAGDVDETLIAGKIHCAQQALNIFETEFDSEQLRAEKPGQRFAVGHAVAEK